MADARLLDSRRSLELAQLAPILAVPGIQFVSLQKDEAAAQIDALPPALRPPLPLVELSGELTDFAQTAAAMDAMALPELDYFLAEFLPAFPLTLDELQADAQA